jgi:predicted transport protein
MSEKVRLLRLLSREAVETGELNAYGDRVFTDTRVRRALSQLASESPRQFIELVTSRLGHPHVAPQALERSLMRILEGAAPKPTATSKATAATRPSVPIGPAGPTKGQEYDLEHHLGNKSSLIRELWEAVDAYAETLGADVSRRVRKQYIGYFRGKRSFFTAEIQRGRVLVYLALTPESASPWNADVMRDATSIGHFGMGDIEYSLVTVEQPGEVRAFIKQAPIPPEDRTGRNAIEGMQQQPSQVDAAPAENGGT